MSKSLEIKSSLSRDNLKIRTAVKGFMELMSDYPEYFSVFDEVSVRYYNYHIFCDKIVDVIEGKILKLNSDEEEDMRIQLLLLNKAQTSSEFQDKKFLRELQQEVNSHPANRINNK